jgi:hypothetical protein
MIHYTELNSSLVKHMIIQPGVICALRIPPRFSRYGALFLRQAPGATPISRVNAREKVDSDS